VAQGSDLEIFGKDDPLRTPTAGRPAINRDLARRLLQAQIYTKTQISRALKCSTKSVRRIELELLESGELVYEEEREFLNETEADFDAECHRATGMSFKEWLNSKTVKTRATYIFKFCRRTWESIWGKPSLVAVRNMDNPLGDQVCIQFINVFGDDLKRIRRRKKMIRYLFRFIGRHDLNDRHLTMTNARDPRAMRKIPEISMPVFPVKLSMAIADLERYDPEMAVAVRLKIVTQMRTGKMNHNGVEGDDRGLFGIRVGSEGSSYILMSEGAEYRFHVREKMREEWDITWFPDTIRRQVKAIYVQREAGEPLFSFKRTELWDAWNKVTEKHLGMYFKLHDLRKVSITWLYVMEVPLEIATVLNVGWKDMNTPRDHYLHYRKLLKRSEKIAYQEAIPDWFKEGLEEYTRERACAKPETGLFAHIHGYESGSV